MSLVISPAATLTLNVDLDVDTLKPSLSLSIEVSPEASFLATQRAVLAAWLRKAADDLAASDG